MIKTNNIAFENLKIEMNKRKISMVEIAKYLGITEDTLNSKLSGEESINLDEALRIAREFFPERDVYYLFKELIPNDISRHTA